MCMEDFALFSSARPVWAAAFPAPPRVLVLLSPDPGTTPASADGCAVLWACASLWTPVPCHPCVFSWCHPQWLGCCRAPHVFSGPISHFWAPCTVQAVCLTLFWLSQKQQFGFWLISQTSVLWMHRSCGMLSGLDEPSRFVNIVVLCSVVWEFMTNDGSDVRTDKTHRKVLTTWTQNWIIFQCLWSF